MKKKKSIEAFPTGTFTYINRDSYKEPIVLVEIEGGLLMTVEQFKDLEENLWNKSVVKLEIKD